MSDTSLLKMVKAAWSRVSVPSALLRNTGQRVKRSTNFCSKGKVGRLIAVQATSLFLIQQAICKITCDTRGQTMFWIADTAATGGMEQQALTGKNLLAAFTRQQATRGKANESSRPVSSPVADRKSTRLNSSH